jgi:predicted glycosyltransferase
MPLMVWIDITDAAHMVFFAPVVRRLESAGHTVTITARRFASADLLLRRYGLGAVLTGHHRGGGVGARAVGLLNRTAQLLGSASSGRFDVAAGCHASDFVLTARALGIPQMTFLDDERPGRGNAVNMLLVDEIAVPAAVPRATLSALGAPPHKLFRYPGFREEYALHDVRPDPRALALVGADHRRIVGLVRPAAPNRTAAGGAESPGEAALADLVRAIAARRRIALVLMPRNVDQRSRFLSLGVPGLLAVDGAVDRVGLIAAADFVLGDDAAVLREAAALGTPAYTVSRRAPRAVEAALLNDGRLTRVRVPDDVSLIRKDPRIASLESRDPQLFVDELLELARRRPRLAPTGHASP